MAMQGENQQLSRREALTSALLGGLAGGAAVTLGSTAAEDQILAQARLGQRLLAERGQDFALDLLRTAAPGGDVAADFHAGRMVSIGGFLFANSEAARFLVAAGVAVAR
jgi:hypothetical protein